MGSGWHLLLLCVARMDCPALMHQLWPRVPRSLPGTCQLSTQLMQASALLPAHWAGTGVSCGCSQQGQGVLQLWAGWGSGRENERKTGVWPLGFGVSSLSGPPAKGIAHSSLRLCCYKPWAHLNGTLWCITSLIAFVSVFSWDLGFFFQKYLSKILLLIYLRMKISKCKMIYCSWFFEYHHIFSK